MNKDINQTILKLKNYKSNKPILTVYLSLEAKKSPNLKILLLEFDSLIHSSLSIKEKEEFSKEIKMIKKFLLEDFDTRGNRSIAFFTGGNLFEVLEFEFPIKILCKISQAPVLGPIQEQISDHSRYMVLAADHKKAKMFTVRLGKIEAESEFVNGQVPQNVRANERDFYGRSDIIFRHIEDHLHRHLKLISEKVKEFAKGKNINFVIIGGHRELFGKIKKHLPNDLSKKVLGEFVTELNIPLNKIFLMSKKVAEKIEQNNVYYKMEKSLKGV